jgi:hypothetical protein
MESAEVCRMVPSRVERLGDGEEGRTGGRLSRVQSPESRVQSPGQDRTVTRSAAVAFPLPRWGPLSPLPSPLSLVPPFPFPSPPRPRPVTRPVTQPPPEGERREERDQEGRGQL